MLERSRLRLLPWLPLWVCLVTGCATVETPPLPVPPLPLLPPPAVEVPAPALPVEDRVALLDSEPVWVQEHPAKVAVQAAKRATITPASAGFERGMLIYPYRPYAVYRVDILVPGALHVQFQPGEEIRMVAGYPESHWTVQRDDARTTVESSHLTVTPHDVNLQTRVTVVTSLGGKGLVYYLALHSQASHGEFGVSWRHPRQVGP